MKAMPRKLLATLISFVLLATILPAGVSLPGAPAPVVGGYALAESEGAEPSPTPDEQTEPPKAPEEEAPAPEPEAPAEEPAPEDGAQPEDPAGEPTEMPDVPAADGEAAPAPEATPEVTPEITPEVTPEITPEVIPEVTPEITPEVLLDELALLSEKAVPKASGVQIQVNDTTVREAKIDITADPAKIDLKAIVSPEGALQQVDWTVSPKTNTIVTLAVDGLNCAVTGLKVGTVTITATAKDGSKKSTSCKVSVYKPVTAIEEITGTASLALGAKGKVMAKVMPDDATNKAVTWTSSNKLVVAVDSKGNLTATKSLPAVEADRTVTITATSAENTGITRSFSVTVYPAVTGVAIWKDGAKASPFQMVRNDLAHPEYATAELNAVLTPATGTCQAVDWFSSKPDVAKVEKKDDLTGTVTALKAGTTVITAVAKDGSGKKATLAVTVTALLESVSIEPVTSMTAGNKVQLKALFVPEDASNKTVTWTTGDYSTVATVDSKGVLTALNKPAVTEKAEVTVTVTSKENAAISANQAVSILPRTTSVTIKNPGGAAAGTETLVLNGLDEHKSIQLSVDVTPGGASTAMTWTSSKPKVARVDANSGLVTAVGVGTATITATAKDGTKAKNTCAVKVIKRAEKIEIAGPTDVVTGSKTAYSLKFTPADATIKTVEWNAFDFGGTGSTLDKKGVLTAGSVGANEMKLVMIHATPSDVYSVPAVPLTVTIHPMATSVDIVSGEEKPASATIHLKTSKTLALTAEVKEAAAIQKVRWVSTNPKVATVTQSGDLGVTVTGKAKGSTTIKAFSYDGSAWDSLALTVQDNQRFQIVLDKNADTLYLDKFDEDVGCSWGIARVEGVYLPSGQFGRWTLEPKGDESDFPARLEKWEYAGRVYLSYRDVEEAGTAAYTLSYRAGDGKYSASVVISLKVVDAPPADAPASITYPMDAQTLSVNQSLTFYRSQIEFPDGTQVPEGVPSWKAIELSGGMYNTANCTFSYNTAGDVTVRFKKAGRYVVTAAAGFGNITLTKDIVITVGASPALKVGFSYSNKYAYADDNGGEGTIGYLQTVGYDLTDEEWARAVWTLTRLSGAANEEDDAATMQNAGWNSRYIEYRLKSGTGKVTYQVTLTLDDKSASVNVTLEVKTAKGLPTGLKVPKTAYSLKPGGSITLYQKDIAFTGGSVPGSVSVSKYYSGNWDEGEAEEYPLDGATRFVFPTSGIYTINAVGGISNYYLEKPITATVGDAENPPFRLSVDLDYSTFYRPVEDEESDDYFGSIKAKHFPMEEDGEYDCFWTIERLSAPDGLEEDYDVVGLETDETDTPYIGLNCLLERDTPLGTYEYKVTATTGKYTDDVTFQVEVKDGAGLPSGIVVDPSILKITAGVGEPVFLAYDKLKFETGTAPEGAVVSRHFDPDGDFDWSWETIDEDSDDDGVSYTFNSPGRYRVRPSIAISNFYYADALIEILVSDEGGSQFALAFDRYYQALYENGAPQGTAGALSINNFGLNVDEGETFQWSIAPKGDEDSFPLILTLDDNVFEMDYRMAVQYALTSGTGTATYTVTVTCGEYSASRDISVTVSGTVSSAYPKGIRVPQTTYNLDQYDHLSLYLSGITFASGTVPSGAKVWQSLTTGSGWGNVDCYFDEEEEAMECDFWAVGQYVITARVGIGSYSFAQDIVINVGNFTPSLPGFSADLEGTLSLSEATRGDLGEIAITSTINKDPLYYDDGTDFRWTIRQVSPATGGPVNISLIDKAKDSVSLTYALTGTTGTAEFAVDYTYGRGLYVGTYTFTVTVL